MDLDKLIKEEKLKAMIAQEQGGLPANPPAQVPAEEAIGFKDVARALKPAALPLLGQAAGTVAGMATGPGAPFAVPALEAAGGMGGEALNQMLGITQPSTAAVLEQGILPIGMRGASAVAKAIPSATKGARLLNEIAPTEATNRLAAIRSSVPETS